MKKIILVACILFGAVLVYVYRPTPNIPTQTEVVFPHKTFTVEVVSQQADLERGLSGHAPLRAFEGMLFVFPKSDKYGFWMKDMTFPIDIIWINDEYLVTHIERSLATSTYPHVFYPSDPARFIIEISAGESDISQIHVGDFVTIPNLLVK